MGEKVETLENIIADKLRAISDIDSKLQKNRRIKTKQSNSVEPPNYYSQKPPY